MRERPRHRSRVSTLHRTGRGTQLRYYSTQLQHWPRSRTSTGGRELMAKPDDNAGSFTFA